MDEQTPDRPLTFGLIFVAITPRAQTGENVDVRSGINHDEYDRLLKNM
jgi:hypothetical protein